MRERETMRMAVVTSRADMRWRRSEELAYPLACRIVGPATELLVYPPNPLGRSSTPSRPSVRTGRPGHSVPS